MMWLTSGELVDAVRRCLTEHVAPACSDNYAAVQLAAAVVALDEVAARLRDDDPIAADNERLTAVATKHGVALHSDDGSTGSVTARRVNACLRQRLTEALRATDNRGALIEDLAEVESALAADDARWICPQAIASLE